MAHRIPATVSRSFKLLNLTTMPNSCTESPQTEVLVQVWTARAGHSEMADIRNQLVELEKKHSPSTDIVPVDCVQRMRFCGSSHAVQPLLPRRRAASG